MNTIHRQNIFNLLFCLTVLSGCQFNQTKLALKKLHQGEEVLCTSHPNLIGYTQSGGDATLWINVQVLQAPWETVHELHNPPPKPLQDRSPGTKVAVFSVKKNVDSKPFTSDEPYQLVKRDLIEGENLTIDKENWRVVMIGLNGVRVNDNERCRSGFIYIKEVN